MYKITRITYIHSAIQDNFYTNHLSKTPSSKSFETSQNQNQKPQRFLGQRLQRDFKRKEEETKIIEKKLNCYKNLQIYKRKHKVGKKASSNQQIFKNNILPYLCTINLQNKLLCSEVQNIKSLCRAIFNIQFKV